MTPAGVLGQHARQFRAAVIGTPVGHSLSPRIHDAAYAALGLDWRYGAIEVQPGDAVEAIREARDAHYVGLSVTTPLKVEAAQGCPGSKDVDAIGAANTVVFGEAGPLAHNTDGEGLLDDLRQAHGFEAESRSCGVIGAGATARAVVRALDAHGVHEIVVVDRTADRANAVVALAPTTARVGDAEDLAGLDLVVYAALVATPDDPREIVGFASRLGASTSPGQLVVDVNYYPPRSAFLESALTKEAVIRHGLGMLVHQAARQVELFTGSPAPLEAMWAAVASEPGAAAS